jgi:ArsR family transcriptional regulator
MDTLRDTFKALADPTRLQIMTLLLEREELCVCDFVGALGQVQDRREGLWMHYRVSTDLRPEQAIILASLSDAVGEGQKQELREALEHWLANKTAVGAAEGQGAASCC